jgi:hypothetical protein
MAVNKNPGNPVTDPTGGASDPAPQFPVFPTGSVDPTVPTGGTPSTPTTPTTPHSATPTTPTTPTSTTPSSPLSPPSSPTDVNPSIPGAPSGSNGGGGGTTIPLPTGTFKTITVRLMVSELPKPKSTFLDVNLVISPAVPLFSTGSVSTPVEVHSHAIPIPLRDSFLATFRAVTSGSVEKFFDATRQGKTLLNFGQDFQTVITNWEYDPADPSLDTILVKMYEPLPEAVVPKTQLWITREIAPPVIDRLHIKNTPPPPPKVYLRPPNRNIQLTGRSGAAVHDVTFAKLFSTQSLNIIYPNDPVINQWFTDDVNSAELNIDYADYREFVFFGSAVARLNAFLTKLGRVEELDRLIQFNSGSLTLSGSSPTASLGYPAIKSLSDQRIDLLRSFDGYERFLYYGPSTPYSASLSTNDAGDAVYYHASASWPRVSGSIAPIVSASAWIEDQLDIATAYDNNNQNYLGNNIPTYLRADDDSAEYHTFVDLIGHHFDSLKVYIDRMTDIFGRDNNPTEGTSPDLIWNIAQAFGVDMPNAYALQRLADYTIGDVSVVTPKVYRELAAETWKRFMHNQIHMMKAKGTKESLRALANTYGVLPTTLQIREMGTVGTLDATGSYETYEEQTNVLNLVSGSYIDIPWQFTTGSTVLTLEARVASTNKASTTVLAQADNKWALLLQPLSGSYGRFVLSGSSTSLNSAYLPIYSGDFYSVMLRKTGSNMELSVARADGDALEAESRVTETGGALGTLWSQSGSLHLGASGSVRGAPFVGFVDEFRLWNEMLTPSVFETHVKYPGLYHGVNTTSARDNLYVRLSFNKPKNLGASGSKFLYTKRHPIAVRRSSPIISRIVHRLRTICR